MEKSVCEHICIESTAPLRSPFGKVLSLGFYDGATSGLTQCSQCLDVFRFDMVAWDSRQDVRVFAFSPIDLQQFERVISLLSGCDGPRWPFWLPTLPSTMTNADTANENTEIEKCLSQAREAEFVVVCDGYFEKILASKRLIGPPLKLPPSVFDLYVDDFDYDYWREFLGL